MSLLYITSDRIGEWSGGSKVVTNESAALAELGECEVISQPNESADVWAADRAVAARLREEWGKGKRWLLCHGYAGTFPESVAFLKSKGVKVCWTIAAHDVTRSKKAHEELGLPFNLPHLTEPDLFQWYAGFYLRDADVVICPGTVSAETVRRQGRTGRIKVIPHGCSLVENVKPLPKRFTVGMLGCCGGADKGLRYLLEAWKKLRYSDAVLILAGRDSVSDWVRHLIDKYGGGNIQLMGWVDDVADFYNSISVHVAPTVTEGFNCECLEAMAYSRLSVCSTGAGASDLTLETFPAGDVDALTTKIDYCKKNPDELKCKGERSVKIAVMNTWPIVRERYKSLWRSLLN